MSDGVLIELGEVDPEHQDASEPFADLAAIRRWVIALVAVAAAFALLTGADRQPDTVHAHVAAGAQDLVVVAGGEAYTYSRFASVAAGQPRTVTAYRLVDGRRLWRRTLDGGVQRITPAGGVVAVSDLDGVHSVVLDARTGRTLWARSDGQLEGVTTGGLLLLRPPTNGEGVGAGKVVLTAVNARTGAPVWSRSLPPYTPLWYLTAADGAFTHAVVDQLSGRVETLDVRSGATVASSALIRDDRQSGGGVNVAGRVVLGPDLSPGGLRVGTPGRVPVVAYDAMTLRRSWSGSFDADESLDAHNCGVLWCVGAGTGTRLRLVDPRTGETRWQGTGWTYAQLIAGRLLLREEQDRGRMVVQDPVTGRRLLDTADWAPVPSLGPLGRPEPLGETIWVIRVDRRTGRAWTGRLDMAGGTIAVTGSAVDIAGDCQISGGLIVCRRTDGSLGVWTVPR